MEKKNSERELGRRNATLFEAEENRDRIKEIQSELSEQAYEASSGADVHLHANYQAYLQKALEEQSLMVLEAANAVESARDAYLERAMRAEALERIKRKQISRHEERVRKAERKMTNEMTIQRHRLRTVKSGEGEE